MGLESATYIDGLTATNPTATDPKAQGDDHLRLIKTTLKNTFPNATKAFRFETVLSSKTGTYNVVANDNRALVPCNAGSGAVTINLPAAATAGSGFFITILKTDNSANTVTVDGNGAETIDGAATLVISVQYRSAVLWCDGSTWYSVVKPSYATLSGTETLTNKTINFGNNTLAATAAQLQTALSDSDLFRIGTTAATGNLHVYVSDWDDAVASGLYIVINWTTNIPTNGPTGAYAYGSLLVFQTDPTGAGANYVFQLYSTQGNAASNRGIWWRMSGDGGTSWTSWYRLMTPLGGTFTEPVTFDGITNLNDEVISAITTLTSSTSIAVSFDTRNVAMVTLDHNATFTISGEAIGQWFTLIIKQGTTGGTGTFSGIDKWLNGAAPTLAVGAGKYDVISMFSPESGVVIAQHSGPSS